ncbi:hypothetical protein L7F22_037289 [Adiantum nelumboides]|nr:hypothetical protein [Adiantum nelumboides]
MKERGNDLRKRWKELTIGHDHLLEKVEIVLVGKYTSLQDSYISVVKALEHAALRVHRRLDLKWVEAGDLEPQTEIDNPVRYYASWQSICSAKGILIPGGFGLRGTEGMIGAAKWAREHRVPFLGICLGFQIAVVEFARNVCGIQGLRPTLFNKDSERSSKIRKLYGGAEAIGNVIVIDTKINPEYIDRIERGSSKAISQNVSTNGGRPSTPPPKGLRSLPTSPSLNRQDSGAFRPSTPVEAGTDKLLFIGRSESGERMQVAELMPTSSSDQGHPYYVGNASPSRICFSSFES